MPSAAFEAALPFILRWEGGFVDHPADPGGRTNRGVTQRVYNAWRARQGLPGRDVKHIGEAEVHAIYESGYWVPPRCDLLAQPLDLVQFDTAVNMGPGRAVRFLQQAVGCGVDGDFGPATERAVLACDGGDAVLTYKGPVVPGVLKVREELEEGKDPGWYVNPPGTQAEAATASDLARDGITV